MSAGFAVFGIIAPILGLKLSNGVEGGAHAVELSNPLPARSDLWTGGSAHLDREGLAGAESCRAGRDRAADFVLRDADELNALLA